MKIILRHTVRILSFSLTAMQLFGNETQRDIFVLFLRNGPRNEDQTKFCSAERDQNWRGAQREKEHEKGTKIV